MATPTSYALPSATTSALESLVDRIESAPGDMIDVRRFAELQERLDVKAALATLPEGLSEDDFASILKLALLTECATETYGDAIAERAERFEAGWLSRFNERVWVPDELTHHTPYKFILLNLGFSEQELDREIKETQEKPFSHRGGDLPVQVTTFGVVQEYLTDNWHGLIADLLRTACPEAAYMATRVKRRETLHTVWYRDMTALQVEANPRLLGPVAEALAKFEMPGNELVPELQSRAGDWLPLMGADFERIARDLARLLYEMAGDTRSMGKLVVDTAAQLGYSAGPISLRAVKAALNRLGGPGYGLIGEALLERMGLDYMFRPHGGRQDSAFAIYAQPFERVRAIVRTWINRRLDLSLGILGAPQGEKAASGA